MEKGERCKGRSKGMGNEKASKQATHLSSQIFQNVWFQMHTQIKSSNDPTDFTSFDF